MSKVWFITGAGSGIGRAIALEALAQGDCVVATTRKVGGFEAPAGCEDRLLCLQLDVKEQGASAYEAVVSAAVERFGRVDVLVNNAGYGAVTFFEETSEQAIRDIYEVNVFGAMRVTRAVLPVMRAQRGGRILNVASTAAYAPGPVIYHSSKFAMTGFSVALAFEVEPFGIKVTNVAPGMFRTGFYDAGKWGTEADVHIEDYDVCRWQTGLVADCQKHLQPGDPAKLAKVVYEAATCDEPPLHLAIGEDGPGVLDAYCDKIREDTDAWREVASDTSFDE